jgi:hypothetical protein
LKHYRCYFLIGDGFRPRENIETADDATALLEAEKLILKSSFLVVEVWQQRNFIGRISIEPDLKVGGGENDKAGHDGRGSSEWSIEN